MNQQTRRVQSRQRTAVATKKEPLNRIIAAHLSQFSTEQAIVSDNESVRFEKFVNFAVLQSKVAKRLDVDLVTTGDDDDGIDGVAVIINEELVVGTSDAKAALSNDRKTNDVQIVFIQSKTSESIDKGEFLKFKESVIQLITEESYAPDSQVQQEARDALDVVIDNVAKIRNGRPSLRAYYASAGHNEPQQPHKIAQKKAQAEIEATKCFHDVSVEFVNSDHIIKEWVASYSSISVDLDIHSQAGLPQIEGIEESYLVVMKATEFVDKILTSDDDTIRSQIFEDNVRHYLGENNDVNASIADTIADPQKRSRFPVLNNGITIVSPDVVLRTNKLNVRDPQIVNGCQTSHVLFANRASIDDDMMLTIKVVEAEDEGVYSDLVKATNSQSKVEGKQFLSMSPKAREIEAHFDTFEGEDGRLYFERRLRQYAGKGIPALRIIDLDTVARAFAAMYLRRPDLAFKYPKAMYDQLGPQLFAEDNKVDLYYAGALAVYRIHVLTSSSAISSNARKYKWHILPLIAEILAGPIPKALNGKAAEKYAEKIISVFRKQSQSINDTLERGVNAVQSLSNLGTDKLRRQGTLTELLNALP